MFRNRHIRQHAIQLASVAGLVAGLVPPASPLLGGGRAIALAVPASASAPATSFKQDQRLNALALQFTTDDFAPSNGFGSALVGGSVRASFQSSLNNDIASGNASLLLRMLGLNDLSGTNEPSLVVGAVNGAPILQPGNPKTYNGASDLDWWYSQNVSEIDGTAVPKNQLTGSIVSKALAVGPGTMSLHTNLIGSIALSTTRIAATVGAVSTPLTSTNGFPPGHLPSEMIDPGLQSFESMSSGKLAGNIRAASLAAAPIPASLVGTGLFACTRAYSATNTWLDLLVGGCTITAVGTQVIATQPDQSDPAAPAAGAGAPYTFTRTGNSVTGCKDKNAVTVLIATCMNAAAYSVYFQFTSDRIIVDSDGDGVPDLSDNCPLVPNANQLNTDATNTGANHPGADVLGDVCDDDMDGDGYTNAQETTSPLSEDPLAYCNIMRADLDGDGAISILDLTQVAQRFLQSIPPAPERYNQDADSAISILDLTRMAQTFLQPVSACP